MSMTKMGVTPSNTLPSNTLIQLPIEKVTKMVADGVDIPEIVQDLDGDFEMTGDVFNNVLEDFSRACDNIRIDNKRKVSTPPDMTEDRDPDL